jgi:transcriptional regulator with XRE-family HTH domain
MAAELGISPNNLYNLENGKANPGADLLLKLHKRYGISTEYLLHGKESLRRGSAAGDPSVKAAPFNSEIDSIEELVEFMNISTFFKNSILALVIEFILDNEELVKKIIKQKKQ